jgi:hypothetical protein
MKTVPPTTGTEVTEDATKDCSIDPSKGSRIGLALVSGLVVACCIPYVAIWGLKPLLLAWDRLNVFVVIAAVIVGLVLHEAIHGFTWMLAGRLRASDIAFGMNWRLLSPSAHAKVPLKARAYRIGTVMPCLVLGIGPLIVGTAVGAPGAVFFGTGFVALAAGDLLVLFLLRKEPHDALVQDHPTRWGCAVVARPSS